MNNNNEICKIVGLDSDIFPHISEKWIGNRHCITSGVTVIKLQEKKTRLHWFIITGAFQFTVKFRVSSQSLKENPINIFGVSNLCSLLQGAGGTLFNPELWMWSIRTFRKLGTKCNTQSIEKNQIIVAVFRANKAQMFIRLATPPSRRVWFFFFSRFQQVRRNKITFVRNTLAATSL